MNHPKSKMYSIKLSKFTAQSFMIFLRFMIFYFFIICFNIVDHIVPEGAKELQYNFIDHVVQTWSIDQMCYLHVYY